MVLTTPEGGIKLSLAPECRDRTDQSAGALLSIQNLSSYCIDLHDGRADRPSCPVKRVPVD
jgi:hypothetical protein